MAARLWAWPPRAAHPLRQVVLRLHDARLLQAAVHGLLPCYTLTPMVGDVPLAYFITFRCYGTWLHGDQRGSTDRFHNQYGAPFLEQDDDWRRREQRHLTHPPVALNTEQRQIVETAVQETCNTRKWTLLAINVRMTHVHVVVSGNGVGPEPVLNALKSNATRTLRENGHWKNQYSPWSDSGSKRYLWNQQSVETAIDYVLNRQDGP